MTADEPNPGRAKGATAGPDGGLPVLRKCRRVVGARLQFRDATARDAEFILSLRLDDAKGRHLSKTSSRLEDQVQWLKQYEASEGQVYFIIQAADGNDVGTVRLYDQKGESFCWGSWILSEAAPKSSAVESTLMIYKYGLALGFQASHFDVRKANERVWQYHERLGARRVGEDDLDYFYEMPKTAMEEIFLRYRDRLPDGVQIEF